MPGLDGLRAIAVLAVIAYHFGIESIPGGLLGVGVFFTLSGYLITDILLNQIDRGGIRFKAFWLARARRLLPALFVMLAVVTAWVTVIGPHQAPDFREAVLSAAFYVNNWWLIFHDISYFAQFTVAPPLNHLWSLSIEEQFYILWPILLLAGTKLVPEIKMVGGVRLRLAAVTLALAVLSAITMAALYEPGIDPSRVYYGTDTRALELLCGAALAFIWPSRRLRADIDPNARRLLDGLGIAGLAVIALLFWRAQEFAPFLYRGGFLLLSLATVLAVAAMAHPATRLGPIVGCRPMRWIGERSYGIYLWHFPIIVLTTPEGSQPTHLTRNIIQLIAIFAVSALSWKYIEDPIRHGALGRLVKRARERDWRKDPLPRRLWAPVGAGTLVVGAAIAGLAGAGTDPAAEVTVGQVEVARTVTTRNVARRDDDRSASCDSVVHIGDSTSEGLVSPDYVRDPDQLISAQYARVGATTQHLEVSGARSIYETFEGNPNAHDVAVMWNEEGFDGCWVIAMGTNEAANVAAGSTVGYDERIDSMMSVIGDEPTLWVNVRSLVTSGPYAAANMAAWNEALLAACDRYPNMRVFDWASAVRDDWFIPDGIHFTTPGYAARARYIANALRKAFHAAHPPRQTDSSSCLIKPDEVDRDPPGQAPPLPAARERSRPG